MVHRKNKCLVYRRKLTQKQKHRNFKGEKNDRSKGINNELAMIQRGSILNNRHYTKVCVSLENNLYKIFMDHRDDEDVDCHMLQCLHKHSQRYMLKDHWKDVGFAILIYGSDILSHYGTWDTDKMGGHLKSLCDRIKRAGSPNACYFLAAILQALCYQALLKNKYGKANAYISESMEYIQHLEPCEWTSWVYQMHGMISWNLTEVFQTLADDLFVKAERAFLKCREHNLPPYSKAGFHAKYCAVWALLRTAKVKLKLPWYYEQAAINRYLTAFRVSFEDTKDVQKLIARAKQDKVDLKSLTLYHENIEAEVAELEVFAEFRRSQITYDTVGCKLCLLQTLRTCCQMYEALVNGWSFTESHLKGLAVLHSQIQQRQRFCSGADVHRDGCSCCNGYESDLI